ncbi:MAG TPA: hypothetical protein VG826_22640 [Pirellulales bacterium]|nr:hypothetical protein [Pirellulales bacterium]
MDSELLCNSCAHERETGRPVTSDVVCQECLEHAATAVGRFMGVRGKPEIRSRCEAFDLPLENTALPRELGKIVDVSPILRDGRSHWLLLAEDGLIARFDADTCEWNRLVRATLPSEPDHEPWRDRILKPRLHAAPNGDFAAIVNDYGYYGQVIDLRSGRVTLSLYGGDDNAETVPFSFTFAHVKGRTVAIHRTDWNRLDVSDPLTGTLLTDRNPTSWGPGEDRPIHDLDYFHGAIQISPNSVRIVDDGWVWHPVGVPATWKLEPWISDNVWESEDGPSRKAICARHYYWDHALTWLDDSRIVIGGIGDDDQDMIEGARIFDVSLTGDGEVRWRAVDGPWPCELTAFAGPAGSFFSDGHWLFSSDPSGLSRWDVIDGARTGYLQGFEPTHYHPGARELVQVVDDTLVRGAINGGETPGARNNIARRSKQPERRDQ